MKKLVLAAVAAVVMISVSSAFANVMPKSNNAVVANDTVDTIVVAGTPADSTAAE